MRTSKENEGEKIITELSLNSPMNTLKKRGFFDERSLHSHLLDAR